MITGLLWTGKSCFVFVYERDGGYRNMLLVKNQAKVNSGHISYFPYYLSTDRNSCNEAYLTKICTCFGRKITGNMHGRFFVV